MARQVQEQGFRGPTVCKSVGITYRQLDYWTRTGLVKASVQDAEGSGSQRLYGFTDIVHLKIIKNLLEAGISLQQIRKAIDFLRDELKRPITDVILLSDGKRVFARTSPDEVVDLLAGGQGVFAIAVGKVYEDLQGSIAQFRKPGEPAPEAVNDGGASEAHGG